MRAIESAAAGTGCAPFAIRDSQQLRGVGDRLHAGVQDFLVACELALAAHLPEGMPSQWIEPVQRDQRLSDELGGEIPPSNVGELVD